MKKQKNNKQVALALGTTAGNLPELDRKCRRRISNIARPAVNRPRLPLQAETAAIFDTPAWRARWRDVRSAANSTSVYVAGCRGAMAVGGRLGVPVFKIGTAQNVKLRIAKLNGERHGSVAIKDLNLVDESGWSSWEACKLSACPTHPASPVRVLPRYLAVEIPGWVTSQDFEARFVAALEPISLVHLAACPAGRALAKRRGCGIDELLRSTGGARGPVLATEISVIAPSGDAAALVTLIESIVIGLVLATIGKC